MKRVFWATSESLTKDFHHSFITHFGLIADVRQLFGVSAATANRILAKLTEEGLLQKIRIGRSWGYKR